MDNAKLISQLDLNLLRVFRTLYHEQNMSQTADKLNITPSAVSHAISRLRYALNDPLFERRQNKMLPTAACKRMAPDIIEALNQLQQHLLSWSEFDPSVSEHTFKIGMHEAFEPSVFPKLALAANSIAPNINFESVKHSRTRLAKDLASGLFDIALDVSMPMEKAILSRPLISNRFVVMKRRDAAEKKLDQRTYLNAEHIVVSSRASGLSAEDAQLQEIGFRRKSKLRCQNYHTAREIVASSDCLLTLPRPLAERYRTDDVSLIEMPFKLPGYATQLYWHQDFDNDPALAWLRSTIMDLFDEDIF